MVEFERHNGTKQSDGTLEYVTSGVLLFLNCCAFIHCNFFVNLLATGHQCFTDTIQA